MIKIEGEGLKRRNKEKATFFFQEKLKAHISLIPKGVKNGFFRSELIKNFYYDFEDDEEGLIHLSLCDIFDIKDFKEATE